MRNDSQWILFSPLADGWTCILLAYVVAIDSIGAPSSKWRGTIPLTLGLFLIIADHPRRTAFSHDDRLEFHAYDPKLPSGEVTSIIPSPLNRLYRDKSVAACEITVQILFLPRNRVSQ